MNGRQSLHTGIAIVLGGTMNQQVLTNLDKMIGEMEKDEESEPADAG